jgi:phage terminase large subunit-like protein
MAELNGKYWIINVLRVRLSPKGVEDLVKQTAELDGRGVDILIEQEPGASGKTVIEDYQRRVLRGYSVYAVPATGAKTERSKPATSAGEAGNIFLVRGSPPGSMKWPSFPLWLTMTRQIHWLMASTT